MECAQCGAAVTAGQTTCETCGAPVRHGLAVVSQEEIAGLLADATLLRTWGQYEEAINVCVRIVRMDARNGAAHSLLGDLYRDQGNHREALGWYKLAIQIEPGNEVVRRKLDKMIDYVFKGASRNTDQPAVVINSDEPASAADAPAQQRRFQQILSNLQPVHLVLGCTALAIIIMLIFMFTERPDARFAKSRIPSPAQTPSFTSGDTTNASGENWQMNPGGQAPSITPPPPDTVEGGGKGNPQVRPKGGIPDLTNPTSPGTPSATPTVPPVNNEVPPYQVPPAIAAQGNEDQRTSTIKAAMEHTAKDPRMPFTLDQLSIDPRGNILLEYSVPNVGGLSETKKALLYAGYRLIWTATPLSPETHNYTLRGKAYLEGQTQISLALTADVTPPQADQARVAKDYLTASHYLSNPWWRQDLANAPL